MELNPLTAVSPADGRYGRHTASLAPYFSEFGLIRYRVWVEIEYFIALMEADLPELKKVDRAVVPQLRSVYQDFQEGDASIIKETEKVTNHDVKAVEYFVKAKFDEMGLEDYKEFIHFGLTSQDINNTAIPLSIQAAMKDVYRPMLQAVRDQLAALASDWKEVPMLARTHGQPASPTRLGKEMMVFVERLDVQFKQLDAIPYSAKFGGATGNFNAHHVAYPERDWKAFGNRFVNEGLGLSRSQTTTQIEHYDNLAALCDCLKRIHTILIDLDRDVWTYVSMDYFKQKIKQGEVGSSAMPHKVNPIDFENSEGNLGIANALLEFLSAKLPVSRLQRDLTDSTVLRNIGMPFAHGMIALKSLEKGLGKLLLNESAFEADLERNWAVVAEAIQTILRKQNYPSPYEALKALTRKNEVINQKSIHDFIDTLEVDESTKNYMKTITPSNYTGI